MITRISQVLVGLSALACSLHAWAPVPLQPARRHTPRSTRLFDAHPHRADIDVVFGSADVEGDDEEEMNRKEQDVRRKMITSFLQEQDEEFRQERKKRKWGKYANATTKQDIEVLEEEERNEIARGENTRVMS